jgi:Fe-S cluster assembly protein SufB
VTSKALGARNYSQCDSLLIGNLSNANTFPFISVQNSTTKIEHEASTSKWEEQIFYFTTRYLSRKAVELMISGFVVKFYKISRICRGRLTLKLEGSVG